MLSTVIMYTDRMNLKSIAKAAHIKTGEIGEQISGAYLVKQGFNIITTNYRKKWGEIDIIVGRDNELRFVEVKAQTLRHIPNSSSVSRETFVARETPLERLKSLIALSNSIHGWKIGVTHETEHLGDFLPEERVHVLKRERMARAIQSYIAEYTVPDDQEWQIDLIAIYLNQSVKEAIIRHTEDIVID